MRKYQDIDLNNQYLVCSRAASNICIFCSIQHGDCRIDTYHGQISAIYYKCNKVDYYRALTITFYSQYIEYDCWLTKEFSLIRYPATQLSGFYFKNKFIDDTEPVDFVDFDRIINKLKIYFFYS